MLFYADCANIELLHRMEALGILSGITTNPAILAGKPAPPAEVIAGICRAFPGFPVFAPANAETCSGIVKDAAACAAISPQVVVKIPACAEGLRALRTIRMERLFDNEICITTVMTAAQAILASAAGAGYVAPYIGDIGQSVRRIWLRQPQSAQISPRLRRTLLLRHWKSRIQSQNGI